MKQCSDNKVGQWLALYELGALEESQKSLFQDHLIECEHCHNQLYSLDPVMAVFRDHRNTARQSVSNQRIASLNLTRPASKGFWRWRPFPLLATLSISLVIGIGVFYLLDQSRSGGRTNVAENITSTSSAEPWRDLEIPKPGYTSPSERPVFRNSPARAFDRAMAAYVEDDFAQAIEQLDTISELEPDNAEVKFYLGASLLLAGRSQDAIAPLTRAATSSTGSQLESSHFYLALAYLKSNQPRQALGEFDTVITINGEHRLTAEKLKQQVSDTIN